MRFSRQVQSLVGTTLDGNIQILSLLSHTQNVPTYMAQDLSTSTFYELKVFSDSWGPRSKTQLMWDEYKSLKENSRLIKEWRQDRKTFVLLRLSKAPLLTQEEASTSGRGKKIAGAAGSSILKTEQSLIHVNTPGPDLDDKTAFPSLRDGDPHIEKAKDTPCISPRISRILDGAESLNVDPWLLPVTESELVTVLPSINQFQPSKSAIQNGQQMQTSRNGDISEATVQRIGQVEDESDEQDQMKERTRKKRMKREKGRKEEGNGTKIKIREAKQAVEGNEEMENEIKKTKVEQSHERKESSQKDAEKGQDVTLRIPVTSVTTKSTMKSTSPKSDMIAAVWKAAGAAGLLSTNRWENNAMPPTNFTKGQHLPYNHVSVISEKSAVENDDHNQKEIAIVDTSRLYSELTIHYPRGMRAATQGTEIRLIELKPTSMGDAISCNMYCTSLEKKPQFIALSYPWGKVGKTHTILVSEQKMPITRNLYQALMDIRKPQETVVMWVDAICIDQANLQERNYQVTQMPKIYSAANEVIAWLGESTERGDKAMKLITLSPEDLRKKLKEHSVVQMDLNDLFSRPYWSRVWVLQELASINRTRRACTLRSGKVSVTLSQFRDFLRRILRQIKIGQLKTIVRPRSLLSLSTPDPSKTFLQILWDSSSLEATDARDRVYGIRGISPKFYRDNIDVDYTIDFETLCRKVTALMVKKERSLDILCYFNRYTSNSTSPSWLRDFSKRNTGIPPNMYSCDKGRKANAEIVNRILRTRGICIGRVEETKGFNKTTHGGVVSDPTTSLKLESELSEVKSLAYNAIKEQYPKKTDQIRENRLLEILAGGNQHVMEQLGSEYRTRWQDIWDKRIAFEKGTVSAKEWRLYDESFCSTFGRLIGRCVFTTAKGETVKGHLGLGPRDMQKDDLVCIIYGCKLPVILRKDGRYYTFIGTAYVDGAMTGELVHESQKGGRFWIR